MQKPSGEKEYLETEADSLKSKTLLYSLHQNNCEFGGKYPKVQPTEVTTGPYKWSRHEGG
jgi:hypothetical protein